MQGLRSKLPPPNALVAFEAAARHLSFTLAARELNVTRVAISSQVKILEDFLGVPLFMRLHRALRLTLAGDQLSKRVSQSLAEIATTVEAVRSPVQENRVTVTTTTGCASCWLLPRIGEFRRLHPEVDLRFLISDAYVNLAAEGVDIAIRYGDGNWPGIEAAALAQEMIFPTCSPKYLASRGTLKRPEDLLGHTLLHLDGPYDPQTRWVTWFQTHGVTVPESFHGITLNTYPNLVQATLEGQGIALVGPPLLEEPLRDGTLVRPLDVEPTPRRFFWLATPQRMPKSAACQAFSDWVVARFGSANPE